MEMMRMAMARARPGSVRLGLTAIAMLAVVTAAAWGQPRPAPPQADGSDFHVVNNGPARIEQVYVSATGDRNWGPDRLSRTAIERGDSFLIRNSLTDGCQGDVRAVYAGGAQVERRNQNLCRIDRMYFTAPTRASRRGATDLGIRNESETPIEHLYITRAGDRDWGRNVLSPRELIEQQVRRRVRLDSDLGCQVDIRADYVGGAKVEFHNENICTQTVIVAFAPQIDPAGPRAAGPSARLPGTDPALTDPATRERDRARPGPEAGPGPDAGPGDTGPRDSAPRAANPRAPREAGSGNLTVVNNYRVPLRELYVSPARAREWGRDFLPERVLVAPRERYSVQVETTRDCEFDIKAVWDSDAEQTLRNTNICTGRPVALFGPPPGGKLWSGTGFYVARSGHVLTNRHVIYGCARVEIGRPNGPGTPLRLVAEDPGNDLALLQEPNAPGNPLGNTQGNTHVRAVVFRAPARTLRNGEPSIALGYPIRELLGSLIVTSGIISSLTGGQGDASRFQMQTPIQPGNSGGPVFDETGQVIGVSVARIERVGGRTIQNVNFAVKAEVARKFVEAHGVQVEQAPPVAGPRLTPADITEQQEARVLALVCYN